MGPEKRVEEADQQQMTEETRHKFNRLTFYTLLLAFLGVTMTFVIFSSVALVNITCSQGQAVTAIGTISDTCGFPISGNDTCTGTAGAFFCRKTVTFPAFSVLPKIHANAKSCSGGACSHNTAFGGLRSMLYLDENTTWLNMPAATTPFDGDTSGTFAEYADFSKIGGYRLTVTCPTASLGSTAFIAPQWSNDNGATWRYLNTGQTGATAGVTVDGSGNNNGVGPQCGQGGYNNVVQTCFGGISPCTGAFIPLDANINYLTTNLSNLLIRIVGGNGNGIGDTPLFSRIVLELSITGIINDNRDVLSTSFVCYGLSAGETVTSAAIECDIIGFILVTSFTITFNWQATL